METIHAIYDGNTFKPLEPIPVTGQYEVVITFTKRLDDKEAKKQRLLSFCGTWDNDIVNVMEEMVSEREKFSQGRGEYDFS